MKRYAVLAVLFACLCMGCSSLPLCCPYQLDDVHFLTEKSPECKLGAVQCTLYNLSEKDIKEFSLVFSLYDGDGETATEEPVTARCVMAIAAKTSAVCLVSLDAFLETAPEQPFTVSDWYVRTIHFSDGTRWKDPFGMYAE